MNYNRIPYDSLTIQDYLDVLPSGNKIVNLTRNNHGATRKRYLTNCVTPGHDDKNPSMTLYEGRSKVVYHCYSCAENNKNSRDEINNYFHEKFRGKYANQ